MAYQPWHPPYVIDDHVSDLASLVDHLGITSATICGLSVGGLIAQGLYHKRPDLVNGLILCDTAAKIGDAQMWNDRMAIVNEGGLDALVDGICNAGLAQIFIKTAQQN